MSSLADLPEIVGFFSYSREDDEAFEGTLSALRDAIQRELSAQLGRSKTNFRLWQDQKAIAPGKLWESEIKTAVEQAVFFIPIVTPRAANSHYCKFEFEAFLAREHALGRADLVFPVLYIGIPALENEAQWRKDPVLSIIGTRQYVDWRPFRHLDVRTTAVREAIERFCDKIVAALREPWVSPEERRKQQEIEAQQRSEEERRRRETEAERRAGEEEKQRAEAARQAEREKRQAEAARQAEEEKQRAEVARQAEEEKQRAKTAWQAEGEKRQRQALIGRYPMAAISIAVGGLLILVVVMTVAGVFRKSATREVSAPPVTTGQSVGPNQPPASMDLPTPTQIPLSKYTNTFQRVNRPCSDIKTKFRSPMKFDEYVDAVRWLNPAESDLVNFPGFSMDQSVKSACDNLLKGIKGFNTYKITLNNASISLEPKLERGQCLIFINSVSC